MIDEEWQRFLCHNDDVGAQLPAKCALALVDTAAAQPCGPLQISTNTKQLFLNVHPLNVTELFWSIPVMEYGIPKEGVVKKQMKLVSNSVEEYEAMQERIQTSLQDQYYVETPMKQINNPTARRVKFKDHRKLSVGISRKDIMNCRGKVKKAFDNCFALILRFRYLDGFREIHVKVFATGKMEIPGILNRTILEIVRAQLLELLQPFLPEQPLEFLENEDEENVLINSGFHCGFFVNRLRLFRRLKGAPYHLETSYDPCIYPGIKCRFYFHPLWGFDPTRQKGLCDEAEHGKIKYKEVSFMIFRTGKVLIVGNCNERILGFIYEFIRDILLAEYPNVVAPTEEMVEKNKKPKLRKRWITMTDAYFVAHCC